MTDRRPAAARRLGAQRIRASPDGDVGEPLAGSNGEPVVVGDCQHLYERTDGDG